MYLYEQSGWPGFTSNSEQLIAPLAHLRHLQGRLEGRLDAIGFSSLSEAALENLTQDVVKSTAIEGEHLDYDQVRSSIAHRLGIEIASPVGYGRDVEGMVDLVLDAQQHCQDPLTRERLLGWHGALFPTGRSGFYKIRVARWRVLRGWLTRIRPAHAWPVRIQIPLEHRKP